MPNASGKLTAVTIRNAKPGEKPARLFDGGGLYLEVMPNGSRYWRLKFRHAGKEKRLALGVFPEVSLADARQSRDQARALLREGRDPSAERKAKRRRAELNATQTFEAIASEWLNKQREALAPGTFNKAQWLLGLASGLNSLPIADIKAPDVLDVLRKVEAKATLKKSPTIAKIALS
ncbi:DUF4102 domain-containing protein [Oleiagrimonas sp.]|jgi:hypothetical protein|uniref:tyrosine-type recombinase/integrase n=1 Tax=Oleiagrimonas sp. TaxID=2010330 RepID=UPI00261D963B|nr:DUF4102 domain-containing protein [Oleiagrimonas sp.]MDA3914546.1 Arm DNA-binding domain-containing protein [Oleiagrimonas sp.]